MNKHLHCPDESHLCQHGEDESCPAMNPPMSETPEMPLVERLREAEKSCNANSNEHRWGRYFGEAATALSLAQTEIKGHMRVKDDLEAEVVVLNGKLDDIVNTMKSAGMKVPGWIEHTGQDGKLRRDNLTIAATLMFELEAQQARIAELEKALSRIAKWFGEFPATGDSWTDGSPVSYGAAFGSNGERDYMRSIAREALKSRA